MSQTPKKKSEEKIQNEALTKEVKKKMASNEKEKMPAKDDKVTEKKENAKVDKAQEKKDKTEVKDKKESGKSDQKKDNKPSEPKKSETNTKKPDTKSNGEPKKSENKSNGVPSSNGQARNGQSSNGNGVSESEDSLVMEDELFPELVYEESDQELPEAERSVTRRDQVKQSKTPETPKPAEKSTDLLVTDITEDSKSKENGDKIEVQAVIESTPQDTESRKPDTNFSKSRVKVSPYRRSIRLADQTTTSIAANYTGNNTTMETDIDTSIDSQSILDDQSITDQSNSFIQGIRNIRGRKSYKQLKDINMKEIMLNRSLREAAKLAKSTENSRPTAPVVGRKRKTDADIEMATEATETDVKRMRLIDRVSQFVRRPAVLSPIIGVNSDLPQSAPVASSTTEPETLKPQTDEAIKTEGKRCVIM